MATLPGQKMITLPLTLPSGVGIGTISIDGTILQSIGSNHPKLVLGYSHMKDEPEVLRSFMLLVDPDSGDDKYEPIEEVGVWVTYMHDNGPKVGRIFDEEIDALRFALNNYEQAVFVPFGTTLNQAIINAGK